MADGLDRVDLSPEDFQQLLRMKPIDPDIPGVYALRFVFVFHELIESQRVEWYRAEAFLQSNLVVGLPTRFEPQLIKLVGRGFQAETLNLTSLHAFGRTFEAVLLVSSHNSL